MRQAWIGWALGLALLGCNQNPVEPSTPKIGEVGSETHWLTSCDDHAACGDDNACICGICTAPCGADTCAAAGAAICVPAGDPAAEALCGALPAGATGICAWPCASAADCFPGQICQEGICAPQPVEDSPRRITQRTSTPGPLAIDVLFVVDNSGSMCQEQRALNLAFADVVGELIDTDYRIAVTSTDLEDEEHRGRFLASPAEPVRSLNCLGDDGEPLIPDTGGCVDFLAGLDDPALIRPDAVDGSETLKKWVRCLTTLGTTGDGFERGIAATLRATACDGPNAARFAACCGPDGFDPRCGQGGAAPDFLRPDAILVIVYVTDENDCTAGVDAPALSQFPVCRSLDDLDGDQIPDGYVGHCGGDVGPAACYAADCADQPPAACAAALCTVSRTQNANCEWDRDRLVPVEAVSAALAGLKRDANDVVIWAYVGDEARLQGGEVIRYDRGEPAEMCAPPALDLEACCPGGRCVGEPQTSCESALGQAFSGHRYAALARNTPSGCGPEDGCTICTDSPDLGQQFRSFGRIREAACLSARPACLVGPALRRCSTAEELADPANYALRALADGVALERGVDWILEATSGCPSGLVFRLLEPDRLPPDATVQLHFSR